MTLEHDTETTMWPYDAFISYSHAADGLLAPALQQALHRFAKPWYRRRAMRAFRDQTNLAANPHLWGSIEEALSKSHFFILLASPDAAESKWVRREVEFWLRERSPDTLLIILTAGDLKWDDTASQFDPIQSDALPKSLFNALPEEPLFIDLRWARRADDLSLRNAKFRQLVGRIAATLRGLEPDELFGEDVLQYRRTRRTVWAGVGLLLILTFLSILGFVLERHAARQAMSNLAYNYLEQGRQELLATKPLRSLAFIRSAYNTAPFLADAQYMLSHAMRVLDGQRMLARNPAGYQSAKFNAQGNRALLVGKDGFVEVWDVLNETRLFQIVLDLGERSYTSMSDDGRWLITGGKNLPLHLWDIASGELLYEIGSEIEKPDITALSLDGTANRMVVVRNDGIARLWDLPGGQLVKMIDFGVRDAALSHDGMYMVTGSGNGFIGLWNPIDGKQIAIIDAPGDTETDRTIWSSVRFAAEHSKAVVMGDKGHAVVLALADEPRQNRITPLKMDEPVEPFDSVFSADGQYVAAVGWDGFARIWDTESGEPVMVFESHQVSDLSAGWASFSRDKRFLMTMAAASREVKVWTVADGDLVAAVDGPPGWVLAAAIMPNGAGVVTADRDGGLRRWSIGPDGGQILLPLPGGELFGPLSADFSGNGKRIATGGAFGKIAIFDTEIGELTRSLSLGDEALSVSAVALNGSGTRLLAGGVNSVPKLWDLNPDSEPLDLANDVSTLQVVFDVQLSSDGQVAATATYDEGVVVWGGGGIEPLLKLPDVTAYSIALSPGNDIFVTSEPQYLAIRNLQAGVPALPLQLTAADRTVFAFNKDGTRLAAGGSQGTSWIWDTKSGRIELALEGHTGRIRDLIWISDDRRIVTTSNDGTIRVWNANSGVLLNVFRSGDRNVISVVDSEVQDDLLTFSKGGWLQRWPRLSTLPDSAAIERLSDCHLPWVMVEGVLISRATNSARCF